MAENLPDNFKDPLETGPIDPYDLMAIEAIAALQEVLFRWEREYPGVKPQDVYAAFAVFREAIHRRDIQQGPKTGPAE